MKLIEPSNFHVIDEPLDAIDVIRQRSISGDVDEEPLYLCDISDIIKKHQIWKQSMPRVLPFYGKSRSFVILRLCNLLCLLLSDNRNVCHSQSNKKIFSFYWKIVFSSAGVLRICCSKKCTITDSQTADIISLMRSDDDNVSSIL